MSASGPTDWEKLVREMERLLRLKSFPVAFRMLSDEAELAAIPFMRRVSHPVTLCQLTAQVRDFDWTVGAVKEEFAGNQCAAILGLSELSELYVDGTVRSMVWVKSRTDGKKYQAAIPCLPLGKYRAVALAPLVYKPFDPDIVLIYANPAQMMLLINALQFENYEVMQFFCVGESSCSDAIVRCYQNAKPALTIPCYGERRYGHVRDEDLLMAIPSGMMEKALSGLKALYRRGVRYPICHAGAEADLSEAFRATYKGLETAAKTRGNDRRLLVGVTGGIATGKSTVVDMFAELGAHTVNFDELARKVVEPDQPAWRDIVDYFGTQVLCEDHSLNRKKLGEIIFQDLEKRKRLEGFTHPRISQRFIETLDRITAADPDAIILAEVPLLIEANLLHQYHKSLLVYAPPNVQIRRLTARDGIDEDAARKILAAQIPIDEKRGFVDFVIRNDGAKQKTQETVISMWSEFRRLQAAMVQL